MADDPRNTLETPEPVGAESPKEDAATKATREELKHTVISDGAADNGAMDEEKSDAGATSASAKTPDLRPPEAAADSLKEQVSSPKKKRAHDELLEESQEASTAATGEEGAGGASPKDPGAISAASRLDRSEPEKKRARDETEGESKKAVDPQTSTAVDSTESTKDADKELGAKAATSAAGNTASLPSIPATDKDSAATKADSPSTSSSAFAKSGFSKLTGSASPFGALGAAGAKPGGFGGGTLSSSPSPFGALAAGKAIPTMAPKLTFGGGGSGGSGSGSGSTTAGATGGSAPSPFASLNGGASKPFGGGSVFGGGFGGGSPFGAPKLTSFAKPGEVLKDAKPARPFGAPDSDVEGSGEGEDDEGGDEDSGPEEPEPEEKEPEEPKAAAADDKKKTKLQKVVVDDGEAGESTIFLARAKVYQLDKTANVWKERGAGILKINVPESTIEFDDNTRTPIPETFDASMLEAGDEASDPEAGVAAANGPKVVRLIMRQDHTHRVVINTAVLASTDFVKRETLKAVTFLFAALEGPEAKPVTLQIKMSPPNAEVFSKTIEIIQRELKSLG